MNPILSPQLLLAIGTAGLIAAIVLFVVWLAFRRPRTKHRKRSKREPYVPAYGADESWRPKEAFPPPRPLLAHLDVYELERIAEEDVRLACERLEEAREAVARFEMERDAQKLRDVEKTIVKQLRYLGYDPKEETQEIDPAFIASLPQRAEMARR